MRRVRQAQRRVLRSLRRRDRPSKAPGYAAGAGVTLRGRGLAFVRAFHHLKRAHRAIADAFAAYHTGLFIYRQRKHGFWEMAFGGIPRSTGTDGSAGIFGR